MKGKKKKGKKNAKRVDKGKSKMKCYLFSTFFLPFFYLFYTFFLPFSCLFRLEPGKYLEIRKRQCSFAKR